MFIVSNRQWPVATDAVPAHGPHEQRILNPTTPVFQLVRAACRRSPRHDSPAKIPRLTQDKSFAGSLYSDQP